MVPAAGQSNDGASLGRITKDSRRFVISGVLQVHRNEQIGIGVVSALPGDGELSRDVGYRLDIHRPGERGTLNCSGWRNLWNRQGSQTVSPGIVCPGCSSVACVLL